jgi:hypothetical protein
MEMFLPRHQKDIRYKEQKDISVFIIKKKRKEQNRTN